MFFNCRLLKSSWPLQSGALSKGQREASGKSVAADLSVPEPVWNTKAHAKAAGHTGASELTHKEESPTGKGRYSSAGFSVIL